MVFDPAGFGGRRQDRLPYQRYAADFRNRLSDPVGLRLAKLRVTVCPHQKIRCSRTRLGMGIYWRNPNANSDVPAATATYCLPPTE